MAITVKNQIAQTSTKIGLIVGALGNMAPYLTPDFLTSLGIPLPAVHIISSVIALILVIYQEKPPAVVVDVTPPAGTPPKQGGFIERALVNTIAFFAGFLAIAILAAGMGGCSTMSQIIAPAAQPFVFAAVDVAVAQAVSKIAKDHGGDTPANEKAVALKINGIAKQILAADNSVTTTVAALELDLNAKIVSLHLPPAELEAALILAASIEAALKSYVETTPKGQVVATTQVAIADIANAVITATGAYGS